jgi:hypothetical protein
MMIVYTSPKRFACFISCCMIQGAFAYPGSPVYAPHLATGEQPWF